MILIATATHNEIAFLEQQPGVEVLVTGIGMVEAACSVSRALALDKYDLVVNAGIAGAFPGAAQIGDGVVVANDSIALGLETSGALNVPPELLLVDRVESDKRFVALLKHAGFAAMRGLTVNLVTATQNTAEAHAAHGAEIESMEGFAVLRAAQIGGVPAVEVRGISNMVGERRNSGWDFRAGLRGLSQILRALLESLASQPLS